MTKHLREIKWTAGKEDGPETGFNAVNQAILSASEHVFQIHQSSTIDELSGSSCRISL
jgi:hypothetical protein